LLKLLKANSGANYNSLNFEYQDRQFRNSVRDENFIGKGSDLDHRSPENIDHCLPELEP